MTRPPLAHQSTPRFGRVFALALLAVLTLSAGLTTACNRQPEPAAAAAVKWTCPMHPGYVSDQAGTCPICNMDLIPIEPTPAPAATGESTATTAPGDDPHANHRSAVDGTPTDRVVVELDDAAIRLLGVATAPVVRERLTRSLRLVGSVAPDERRQHRVQAKISGWVERLDANATGMWIRKGQPILAVYSPELLAGQEEYLLARQNAARFITSDLPEVRRGGEELVSAARRRLELLDVPASLLAELERSGIPRRTVELLAPASGYVTDKLVVAGQQITPGMELLTLADLTRVWVEADVPEQDARFVGLGTEAVLTLTYDPAQSRSARVAYVYPSLAAATRTLRLRFELDNSDLSWKPGMFVDVDVELSIGEGGGGGGGDKNDATAGVVVPDSAVLDSGSRQLVFVVTRSVATSGDAAASWLVSPRLVTVLARSAGKALLAEGAVAPGDEVAIRANFLLDGESRLRAALAQLTSGAEAGTTPAASTALPDPHAGHRP